MNRTTTLTALAGAAVFAGIAFAEGSSALALVRLAVFGAAVGAVALVDLREHRIPNRIVLPAAAVCALLAGPARSARERARARTRGRAARPRVRAAGRAGDG